ncbi:OsmC family protein [Labilibaculum sp.]|uniref:OsmC family protein n=1 Tax=Labilibaculum sp. TaxID=2060723 RepID=UPI003562D3B6
MKATTSWTKQTTSIATNHRGHEVILDLPEEKGGVNHGATALELCLMSYSGCINTIFNMIAQKMRIEFTALEVETTGEQNNNAPTFTHINIELRIDSDASDVKIQKCLDETLKTCPVGILFQQAGVKTIYKIIKMENA